MTRRVALKLIVLAFSVVLASCAAGPGIPDTTYYRLGAPGSITPLAAPITEQPLVVPTFLADGVHSDQALLYGMDSDGLRLRAYHYQLWVDPPTRMLQRRLIGALRRADVARLVVDSHAQSAQPARITGRIIALERVPAGDGWKVKVALGLRYEPSPDDADQGEGMVKVYREEHAVSDGTVVQSALQVGVAVDAIFARFVDDLRHLQAGKLAQ